MFNNVKLDLPLTDRHVSLALGLGLSLFVGLMYKGWPLVLSGSAAAAVSLLLYYAIEKVTSIRVEHAQEPRRKLDDWG